MGMKLQRHERNRFYHLPIYCGFCGQLILSAEEDSDPVIKPCLHTLFIAHDEGFEFLSERAADQLRGKGFTVSTEEGGSIEVTPTDEDEIAGPDEITDQLEFADGLKVAAYVGPPAGFGSYVGFAPLEDE
jgi:hypothetical protein